MLQPGTIVDDRYEIEALVGEGGLAEVYRVRHVDLGSIHALKVLIWRRKSLMERLVLEGRIQAQLRHPNVVTVTDLVRMDGQIGLLMEYIDHETLEHYLEARGALPVDEALALMAPVLSGVTAAHDAGVLHRDLKPANVMLARDTRGVVPKVADFGIAKVVADEVGSSGNTKAGVTMGTPGYLPPEQVLDSAEADARADVFALGAILYECIAGRRAFADDDGHVDVQSTLERDPPRLSERGLCDEAVCEALQRSMAKDRDARFPDVRSFARALYVGRPDLLSQVEGQQLSRPLSLEVKRVTLDSISGRPRGGGIRTGGASTNPPAESTMLPDGGTVAPITGSGTWSPTMAPDGTLAPDDPGSSGGPPTGGTLAPPEPPPPAPGPVSRGAFLGLGVALLGVGGLSVVAILSAGVVGGILLSGGGSERTSSDRTDRSAVVEPAPVEAPAPAPVVAAQAPDDPEEPPPTEAAPDPAPQPADPAPQPAAPVSKAPAPTPSPVPEASAPEPEPGDAPDGDAVAEAPEAAPPEPAGVSDPPDAEEPAEARIAALTAVEGTWQGTANNRPFTIRFVGMEAEELMGEVVFTLGPTQRTSAFRGTYDAASGAIRLRDTQGDFVYDGKVSGSVIRGTYGKPGSNKMLEFRAERR